MIRYVARRLLAFPLILFLANGLGFAYAFFIAPLQAARNPYSTITPEIQPLPPVYLNYLQGLLHGDLGRTFTGEPIIDLLMRTTEASLGLLGISLVLSIGLGILIGLFSVRGNPPHISATLTALSSVGLATPSFYIGILLIGFSIIYILWGPGQEPLLPFQGFGWDAHLVLPTIALIFRPTVQVAQVTAGLMTTELGKLYVLAARSFGRPESNIRNHFAFRNLLAPVALTAANGLRIIVAELIIIERLFNWPGIGRLFAQTLVLTSQSDNFLHPPLVAALLTELTALFLLADLAASIIARGVDPRIRQ